MGEMRRKETVSYPAKVRTHSDCPFFHSFSVLSVELKRKNKYLEEGEGESKGDKSRREEREMYLRRDYLIFRHELHVTNCLLVSSEHKEWLLRCSQVKIVDVMI